jgi:UDP-N-acetylmuramoyl-L-alanyl-D-glutamate--2,6-diaminopimelate ligase
MFLKDLFPQYSNLDLEISSIEIDSRLVKKGSIFFALQGHNVDGAKFIDDAIAKGAIAVVSGKLSVVSKAGLVIEVEDVYSVLVTALQKFYPNLPENILAVTGTNGKTSVAYFIQQMQEILGKKSASIGTIGIKTSDSSIQKDLTPFTLTTPDIVSLYKNLSILKQHGVNDIAIEASSIGLEQKRLAGLKIGLGAFTNFTQDHLDYHGSMEKYFECKMLLFKEVVKNGGIAVLNADIAEFEKIKEIAASRGLQVAFYSAKEFSIVIPKQVEIPKELQSKLDSRLRGNDNIADFQKANLLCSLLSVSSYYKLNPKQITLLTDNLDKIKPAEGRMQLVATLKNGAKIFIDYAHTPDALQNVLQTAQKMPHNNLHILFGCGGDRDKSKRAQMGKIASDLANFVIVTDDNPRTENAAEIRKEILIACDLSKTIEIKNRKEAIKQAISRLSNNDILIIAGKGHEKYQIIGTEKFEFDEEKIINNFVS